MHSIQVTAVIKFREETSDHTDYFMQYRHDIEIDALHMFLIQVKICEDGLHKIWPTLSSHLTIIAESSCSIL